ncbi:hypothetical protein LCFBJUUZ_CDS0037 [Staphylococcus phage PG-2021_76]
MKEKTREEVKKARKELLKSAEVKSITYKGDKRISSPSRVCGVCRAPLSGMNYVEGVVLSKKKHIHLQYSKFLYIDICYNITDCYRNLKI